MKKIKGIIAVILCLSMIFTISTVAFAADTNISTPISTIPNDFVAPTLIIDADEVPIDKPQGIVINDLPSDPLVPARATTIYGPYYNLYLDESKMQIIMAGLKAPMTAVNYAGANCFKFTSGNTIVYIACSTFAKTTSGRCTSFGASLSEAINSGDSDGRYATFCKSYKFTYNGYDVYRWSFTRIEAEVFYFESDTIHLSFTVADTFDVDIYNLFTQGTYVSNMVVKPEVDIDILNTGTNNQLYFGGYEILGRVHPSSINSLGQYIEVGYSATQMIGAVSGLSLGTIRSLFNNLVTLTKGNVGSSETIACQSVPLSNVANEIYAYECKTTAPIGVRLVGDYVTIKLGIIGTPVATTRYSIICDGNVS